MRVLYDGVPHQMSKIRDTCIFIVAYIVIAILAVTLIVFEYLVIDIIAAIVQFRSILCVQILYPFIIIRT